DDVLLGTETTLSMANERIVLANEIAHKNSLDCLREIESLSDEEDYEELEVEDELQQENFSSKFPVVVECDNAQTKSWPHYLDVLPIHAEYLFMEEDWIMNGVTLSNNLKGTGRGHFNFSDTECTSQISDEHWENVLVPFLTQHKLKNALSTENDEKILLEMFGEENKKKLLEQGNLKLIVSLCDTEEDATKVLEMVKRIRLVLYLKGFADCQTLKSLEMKWAKSIPSDILDKQLRDILWATELIKW
ncbi:11292_t:CDS:2, partial [Funneliformis geosporum]